MLKMETLTSTGSAYKRLLIDVCVGDVMNFTYI